MYSFAGLVRRTLPPTFSDAAMTDCQSDTTFFSSKHTGCGYPSLFDRKKSFGHASPVRVESSTSCVNGETPYPLGQALRRTALTTHFIDGFHYEFCVSYEFHYEFCDFWDAV